MFTGVARQVEQRIDFRYRDLFRAFCNLHDFVAGADFSFLQNAEIEPRPFVRYEQAWHLRVGHADADSITSDPRLGYFEQRATYLITVADADLVVGKAIHGQVFTELTVLEVVALQLFLPVTVGVELVDHHGPVLPAVACEVSLAVSVQIQAPRHHPARDGFLPDAGVHQLALPFDVTWKTDIDRDYRIHAISPIGKSMISMIAREDGSAENVRYSR